MMPVIAEGQLSRNHLKTSTLLLALCIAACAACHRTKKWHDAAGDQTSHGNTSPLGESYIEGLNGNASTDVLAIRNYTLTISELLKEEKFDELDALAAQARLKQERFSGGEWKLHQFYEGLSEPTVYLQHSTEDDWTAFLQRLQQWLDVRPLSITACVALAKAYMAYAWDARGDGEENSVSESGLRLFADRTAYARRILQRVPARAAKCPEWYAVMLEVAENQRWPDWKRHALFANATKRAPDYYYYSLVVAFHRLPETCSKAPDVKPIAETLADRLGGEKGDILYFQIATAPALTRRCSLNDPHLSLPRIERGFEASEKRFGASLLNLNRVAFLASRYDPSDEVFADKIFARIGEQWDEETWSREQDFVNAKDFAAFKVHHARVEGARFRIAGVWFAAAK
jgi:hypothetical protein